MTIYTFNLLVGFEPNGVDVAQASRAKMLRRLGVAAKFVFTTWPLQKNWPITSHWGTGMRNCFLPI